MRIEISDKIQLNSFPTKSVQEIPVVENTCLSYENFFQDFIITNQPCKIKSVAVNWECAKVWIKENKPNFQYLESKYGTCKTSVYNCREKYFNSQKCETYLFSDFINYWKSYIIYNYPSKSPLLYLKDWHVKNEFPQDNFYEVPVYFASDWLNEYLCEANKDDYRFVYMGPKGTWTPFHVDVFTSYSWSVNICGRKKWLFVPPGEEAVYKDALGNLPYDIEQFNTEKCIPLIQRAGEAVFIPSGWHHQVWNLEDTISVNHNWINGCNIQTAWLSLKENLNSVKKEIDDCRDMDNFLDHCQIVLKASFGLNFLEFYDFVKHIALKRINLLENDIDIVLPDSRTLGKNHARFDLKAIETVIDLLVQHTDVDKLISFQETEIHPTQLNEQIRITLSNSTL